jgi:hypothetical protein
MQSLPSVFIFTAISVANTQQDNLAVEPKNSHWKIVRFLADLKGAVVQLLVIFV